MPHETRIVAPGTEPRTVRTAEGRILSVPAGWELLPPGDVALTRRVKAAGPSWVVQEKRGRRTFSQGLWAPGETIAGIRSDLAAERSTESHSKKMASAAARRDRLQREYVDEFRETVRVFLAFDPRYAELADRLATVVTEHATPVGSGTVARTQRLPVARRAEAAVIAWLRHQTTAYDNMAIPRIRGHRREVRAQLAAESRRLLQNYRDGRPVDGKLCPLQKALRDG